jgi:hypothetical protein
MSRKVDGKLMVGEAARTPHIDRIARESDMATRRVEGWHRFAVAIPAIVVVLLGLAGCTQLPTTEASAIPPIPPGKARVWFYRDLEPFETLARPAIAMNDAPIGLSEPGGAFYRDVAPGRYHVSVETYGRDINQSKDLDLAPGAEGFVKIVSLRAWVETIRYERDTFYVWLETPETGRRAVAGKLFFGGA